MTIRRGSLYAGAFVLAVGVVTLANSAGALDRGAVGDAVATLWPVAVIAVGLALLLRRTSVALPMGVAAAAVPGLLLGGSLVAIPTLSVPCTGSSSTAATSGTVQTQQGTLPADGTVSFHVACGELDLTTQAGSGWRLDASDGAYRHTSVSTSASGLTVTGDGSARGWSNPGRVTWTAILPTDPRLDFTARVEAGRARLDLSGANLRSLDLGVNAGDLRADLTGASLGQLDLEVNAGSTAVTLPAAAFTADVTANAGSVKVCVPPGVAVRVHAQSSLGSVRFNGLVRDGDTWFAPGTAAPNGSPSVAPASAAPSASASASAAPSAAVSATPSAGPSPATSSTSSATPVADLTVRASVGSVSINSQGGCQ